MSDLFDTDDENEKETPSASFEYQEEKKNVFKNLVTDSFTAMQTSFDYLLKTIERNPDRIIFAGDKIIILGKLATYSVPLDGLIQRMRNPYAGGSGLNATTATFKGKLDGKETSVCIQPDHQNVANLPGCDVLDSYFLMLLNDDKFIQQERHGPLRHSLLNLYGLSASPASEALKEFFDVTMDATYIPGENVVEIKGTNGWKWRMSDGNPLVKGFTIWFKKPRQRAWKQVVPDTVEFEYAYHYEDVFSILELLSDSPRVLVEDETYASDGYFRKMVAPHYSPLEKRLIADENNEREGAES
ncbi:MAG: hypothetical protein HN541_00195 [Euryarchaeota archaeon]|nr:hypothetical protein [Euryarchaeota archaeon]